VAFHQTKIKAPIRFPRWLAISLPAVAVAGIASLFFWHKSLLLAPQTHSFTAEIERIRAAITPPAAPSVISVEELYKLQLMGRYEEPKPDAPPSFEDIPETQLELSLKGVFSSKTGGLAAALIQVDQQRPKYYTLGSQISEGIQLVAVGSDGVTLKTEEGYEKLLFKKIDIWSSSVATVSFTPSPEIPRPSEKDVIDDVVDQSLKNAPTEAPLMPGLNRVQGSLEDRLKFIREKLKR
tara:strand:- start:2629 stop:3339 length:711 start_codon:yes stop_codon:yes gene_type:complete